LWISSKFYQDLIGKFQSKYNLVLDGTVDYNLDSANNGEKGTSHIFLFIVDDTTGSGLHKSYLSCHRCLIFLGDLGMYHLLFAVTSKARYHRDLYGHPSQKDWTKAANYYQQALHLIPDNGNPHNQLAVLATYADDEFNAVYHYFMSLAVTAPFLTAKDNLAVLFEKNRQKLASLDEACV
jgi:protein SMG7